MAATEERVMVECALCQVQYDCSARTARDIRAERVEPRCAIHRKRSPRPRTKIAEYRRFWLDRFSLDEIRYMGRCVDEIALRVAPSFRADEAIGQALTASAAPPGPVELGGR